MSRSGSLRHIRRANVRTIIEALTAHEKMSRAALCRVTGLSRTTVHRILRDLIAEQALVETVDADHTGPGRPEGQLAVNPEAGVVVGLELGRSVISAVLLNYAGDVVWGEDVRLERPREWDDGLRILLEMVTRLVEEHRTGGCALKLGVVGLHGLMPSSANYPGSDERDRRVGELRTALSETLGVPMEVHSNARLAAVAEFRGLGLSEENLVYCHLSRGIGAAVIVGGRVLAGSTNSAGEFGHMRLVADGEPCHCGGVGCVETVVGLDRVMQRARAISPGLRDFPHLCGSVAGSQPLQDLAVTTASALGHAIGNMCNVVNPEYVVLGGELVDLLPDWVDRVGAGVRETALRQVHEGLQVSASQHQRRAGALGAGLLALDVALGRTEPSEGASW